MDGNGKVYSAAPSRNGSENLSGLSLSFSLGQN